MRRPSVAALAAAFLAGAIVTPSVTMDVGRFGESDDALVTITADSVVGAKRLKWRIYEGSIDGLYGNDEFQTSIWATELFGRRQGRMLFAAASPADRSWPEEPVYSRLAFISLSRAT